VYYEHRTLLVLCGYETWFLTRREEYSLKVSENRVLRRIFEDLRRVKWREIGEDCIMKSFITCLLYEILSG